MSADSVQLLELPEDGSSIGALLVRVRRSLDGVQPEDLAAARTCGALVVDVPGRAA